MSYKTIPIVKVRPADEYFVITWQVDLKCNFDCMYCPPSFHNLTANTKTLLELQTAWEKIFTASKDKNLKYKINFTGGEVTINKDFLPFVVWLNKNYKSHIFQLSVSTNGSASNSYYLDLIKYVDSITFSTHSEFFNEEKFFKNVMACVDAVQGTEKTIQVSIMNEPWHQDRIGTYIKFLLENSINYSLNEIDFSKKIRPSHKVNSSLKQYNFDNANNN